MKKLSGSFVKADPTKCTGCKACEMACFTVHNRDKNQVGGTVGTVKVPVIPNLHVTKLGDMCMPIQCKHCEDAPCLNACQKKAIVRIDNQVIVKEELCIGCKDCVMACPFGAIVIAPSYKDGEKVVQEQEEVVKVSTKCDLCMGLPEGPACVRSCPNEALQVVHLEDEIKNKQRKAAESLVYTK